MNKAEMVAILRGKVLHESAEQIQTRLNQIADELEASERIRHGYWIGIEADGYADGVPVYHLWECSECGYEEYGEDVPQENPFCRSCGAKMDRQKRG